jgi:photosystem II stability/assembly factor-like uncharacterized protein
LVAKTSGSARDEDDDHRQEVTLPKKLVHFLAVRYRLLCLIAFAGSSAWWSIQSTGTDANLRGVSVITDSEHDEKTVVWATGSNGTVLRTVDSGKHWKRLEIPSGGALDFRGVYAVDDKTAYVMSSGEGEKSRIYKTKDGGASWELQYTDKRKAFFLDAISCWNETHCFALSDPVDGKFLLLRTEDGTHWSELPRDNMPAALANEGAFAASNSSLTIYDGREIYFATGGASRVFRSKDLGKTWAVSQTPVISGKASCGIFSIVVRASDVVVVGGDYQDPKSAFKNAAVSHDFGETWQLAKNLPGGYRSSVAYFAGGFVTVGPSGAELSTDGLNWEHMEGTNLNAIGIDRGKGWAVGSKGSVATFWEIINLPITGR